MKKKWLIVLAATLLLSSCSYSRAVLDEPTPKGHEMPSEKSLSDGDIKQEKTGSGENGAGVTEDSRTTINSILQELSTHQPESNGAPLSRFQIFVEILNKGEAFLLNPEETKDMVSKFKENLQNKENYEITISKLETLNKDYHENADYIKERIKETGVKIKESPLSQEKVTEILNYLR